MALKKVSHLAPVLLLALMSCVSSNPTDTTVAPMDIGGVTTQASGLFHVITASDRAAHQPSPLVSEFVVVHHFASIAPVPIGDATGTNNPGTTASNTQGTGGASGTSGGGTPTPTPTLNSGGNGGTGGTASGTTGVSTYAGSTVGYADGPGASAQFKNPVALAIDGQGNVYVADTDNDCIRKIDTNGTVSTFAGQAGQAGLINAQGNAAKFSAPTGLAFDASGNLYVADSGNNVIRKITPDTTVSTFAGSGQQGNANGAATSATFNQPYGVTAYQGAVYVSDAGNNLIRAIASGTVSTLAGNGTPGLKNSDDGLVEFNHPEGLGVGTDASGTVNLYVADTGNGSLRSVSLSGVTSLLIGDAQNDRLGHCGGLTVVGHMCYITNSLDNTIDKYDITLPPLAQGQGGIFAGNGTAGSQDAALTDAEFNDPEGIAGVASGTLFVVDKGTSKVRKLVF